LIKCSLNPSRDMDSWRARRVSNQPAVTPF
jgi:hypothetical protein